MDRTIYQLKQWCQRGFSLLEMMLVLLISATLSTTGLYGWQRWQQQQHLTQTVRQVGQFLQWLRDDANWHNRNHYLWLNQQGQYWCLGSSASEIITNNDQHCDITSGWQFHPPFNEVRVSDFSEYLAFYGVRNTVWAGHITLRSPAGEWKIIVSKWGRIRSCPLVDAESC